jgi:glycosyltransferase involved in cell wall biosynthesis
VPMPQRGEKIRLVELTRSFYYGGTEVQLVELLRGLNDRFDIKVANLEAGGPLLEAVAELGHLPEEFPLKGSAVRPGTFAQIARMAFWLRRHRIQVLHVHDFYSTLLAVPAAKLAGCKVIVGRLDLAHWHGKARRAVLAQLTRMADHVIANAHAIREMLIRDENVDPNRITVIHNGLDIERFDARREKGLSSPLPEVNGAPVILHVANMNHPVKRQDDLLVALKDVRQEFSGARVFFVGDGARRAGLEAKAKAMGLEDAVHFLGYRDDVAAVYDHCTVGVLCSNAEGLSNAVMEGMAASVPMVVTSVGGNPELVADGQRGRVVAPEQPDQLAQALRDMLREPEHARRMGRSAREFVEQQLSLSRMVAAHEHVYRQVLEAGSGARESAGTQVSLG